MATVPATAQPVWMRLQDTLLKPALWPQNPSPCPALTPPAPCGRAGGGALRNLDSSEPGRTSCHVRLCLTDGVSTRKALGQTPVYV